MTGRRFSISIGFGLVVLGMVAILCLVTGYTPISVADLGHILRHRLTGSPLPAELQQAETILFDLRLPRLWVGILVGGTLSISGCVFQGLLRNPLADPYILGVSTGAILGVAIAIVLPLPGGLAPVFGLGGAVASLFLVYFLALDNRRLSSNTLLLAGVITNFFFSAILMVLMTKAGRQLIDIINMLMGSLAFIHTSPFAHYLWLVSGAVIGLAGVLWLFGRDLNALALGDEMAQSMGVDVIRLKKWLFILTSAAVGLVVSMSGAIGFVGIIIPHVFRLIFGPDHRFLIPISFIGGSAFLILCDTAARTFSAVEIPVGVITAFFGAPFFAWLLKTRRSSWNG